MKKSLSGLLGLGAGARVAVAGCGGKTSLIGLLAQENAHSRVLVMPTTKIYPMRQADVVLCTSRKACLAHRPRAGIQCLGVLDEATGKLTAPPQADWAALVAGYDLVLMEADGSRGLPLKGWRKDEPVVPGFTTLRLGVLPIAALGLPATGETVCNLPAFHALTGLAPGGLVGPNELAAMAGDMLRRGPGAAVLVLNQVESAAQLENAGLVAEAVRRRFPGLADAIVAGSVFDNCWQPL